MGGRRCIAPRCTSGYKSNPEKVHFFMVPREESLRAEWQRCIPLDNFIVKHPQAVCEKHFVESDIRREKLFTDSIGNILGVGKYVRPQLKPGAVPRLFPQSTKYTSKRRKRRKSAKIGTSIPAKQVHHQYPVSKKEDQPGTSNERTENLGPRAEQSLLSSVNKAVLISNPTGQYAANHREGADVSGYGSINNPNVKDGGENASASENQGNIIRQTTLAVHSGKVIGHPAPDGDGAEGSAAKIHSKLLWHGKRRKPQKDRNSPSKCPALAKDSDITASHFIEISASQTTAGGTPAVHGEKAASRPVPGGDGAQVPAKKPRARKKADDASSVGPSRKSPRVIRPKWPILPQEGVCVAESAISFQEVMHHDGERESNSMDESAGEVCPLNKGRSHLEKCRLCFMELEDFTYIFEFHDAHHFNVGDVINDLMGLDVNPNDGYPSMICNYCLEELSHFRNFKRKCFETKARIRQIMEAGTDSEEASEDAACPSGAGEVPVHSEAVDSIVIKQEVDEPESHQQPESGIEMSRNHASNSVEQVKVKKEVTSSSVDEVTFSEEFIIPDEPISAEKVNELPNPCQPASVSKVAVRKGVTFPYQPMSVDSSTVNKEIMMPCQPSSVGKVTVRKELIIPCGTTGDNNDGSGEVMGRERITQVLGKRITMEMPNVPHPQICVPEVPADGFFVPVKVEVDSDGEEVGGGDCGEGRMAS